LGKAAGHTQPGLFETPELIDHARWVRGGLTGECARGGRPHGPYTLAETLNIYTHETIWYVLDRDGHGVLQFSGAAGRRLAEFQIEHLPW
jgi:hypothetical protein